MVTIILSSVQNVNVVMNGVHKMLDVYTTPVSEWSNMNQCAKTALISALTQVSEVENINPSFFLPVSLNL